jgi:hypothetical protein
MLVFILLQPITGIDSMLGRITAALMWILAIHSKNFVIQFRAHLIKK